MQGNFSCGVYWRTSKWRLSGYYTESPVGSSASITLYALTSPETLIGSERGYQLTFFPLNRSQCPFEVNRDKWKKVIEKHKLKNRRAKTGTRRTRSGGYPYMETRQQREEATTHRGSTHFLSSSITFISFLFALLRSYGAHNAIICANMQRVSMSNLEMYVNAIKLHVATCFLCKSLQSASAP